MAKIYFDAVLTEKLASRLYAQGRTVLVKYIVMGAVLFSALFYFAASMGHTPLDSLALVPSKSLGVGLLIGVVLGFIFGQEKACKLKLEAQLALCQLEIERNLRAISPNGQSTSD